MNREQKIKAVEGIIFNNIRSGGCDSGYVDEDSIRETATAIIDSMEIDKNELRKIIFDNTYVDKSGFSGQPEVSGISKTINNTTTDIIKIKE